MLQIHVFSKLKCESTFILKHIKSKNFDLSFTELLVVATVTKESSSDVTKISGVVICDNWLVDGDGFGGPAGVANTILGPTDGVDVTTPDDDVV